MAQIDHVDLVVSSLEVSLPFYRNLLGPLGWRWVHEVQGERGETIHYLIRRGGRVALGLREPPDGAPVPHDRYSIGVHHVAVDAGSRRAVRRAAEWARSNGVDIESGPQQYAYSPGYYAVFLYDPDGIKLEVMCRPLLRTALWTLRPTTTPFRRGNRGVPRV